MITPDHADQPRRQDRRGSSAMVIALVAVLIAGFTLVSLTSPDPATLQATTTTSTTSTTLADVEPPIDLENFSVDQLARGEPFEWENTLSVVEGYPVALLSHGGGLYLFSTDIPNFTSFDSGGLRAWRSGDGLTWKPLGEVIDRSRRIGAVASTGRSLVAVDNGTGRSGFTVWLSENGSDWKAEELPLNDADELSTVYPTAAGGSGSVVVVAGDVNVDLLAPLREKLGDIADYGWGADVIADEVRFTLYGPLGWRLGVVSGDEIGLTEEEEELITNAYSGQTDVTADVWMKNGDSDWERSLIPEADWIDRIATTPDGEVIVHGWGSLGANSWTSKDGTSWEEAPRPVYHYLNERWGDQLVAPHSNGRASVFVSSDGQEWEDIGPIESFPRPIQWWTSSLAAGPGGIATTIDGWTESAPPFRPTTDPRSVTITNEDATLTIDVQSGEYTLDLDDQTYTWHETSLRGVEVDLDTRSLRYLDPETGDPLASFPLDDIIEAQSEVVTIPVDESSGYGVFAFTGDGAEWTIQPLDDLGSGATFNLLAVTGTHVVAVAVDPAAFYDPSSAPGFGVWTAAIP